MKLQAFNGGLGTRTRPQYLNTNQGVEHNNIDFNAISLAPVQSKTAQELS